ncbi:negative transcriptional regulator [Novosphingobium sp. PC22D]|uniref:FMN-binding negative transcriptional regulator n=1 Tax=Novosphingobium sp. PC22D TaxID=1962403 RepID=UPI000BF0E8FE|nr:FMN-binding negative transcriptional regulator [Novosphingobium sp. PC22D]PEQ13934.1 negative transcriptional regulator [Novosphingobium sp. PC22D]
MHPNAAFRHEERALWEALVEEVGFGMVFAQTPDGPRVAHTPLLWTGDGAIQFHLSRGNALTKHLAGASALAVVNGPEAYVSPRWYAHTEKAPTWNYVAIEMEGRVRKMAPEGLVGFLEAVAARQEARIVGGEPWRMSEMEPRRVQELLGGIVGFELEVSAWRPTFKLSQTSSADERERIALGLEDQGAMGMASLMREIAG